MPKKNLESPFPITSLSIRFKSRQREIKKPNLGLIKGQEFKDDVK